MRENSTEMQTLKAAVNLALNDDWHGAHHIAQDSNHLLAHWIHAVLHKIEGDEWNSRYWYRRTDRQYEDYADPRAELQAILKRLDAQS
ncbi:MAG: hypothetical protein RBS75_02780 [Methylophilaceae bacterium]|jgi:hypothetical protein|nr:hypothetical protein [Methylophilaceae bacterium]